MLLIGQCHISLLKAKRTLFLEAIYLCRKRSKVSIINYSYLRDFSSPIIVVSAKHDRVEQANISTKDGGNLSSKLPLCISARIILLYNIQTKRGLVNGATSIVKNILQDLAVENPRVEPPIAILVVIKGYTSPSLYV